MILLYVHRRDENKDINTHCSQGTRYTPSKYFSSSNKNGPLNKLLNAPFWNFNEVQKRSRTTRPGNQ